MARRHAALACILTMIGAASFAEAAPAAPRAPRTAPVKPSAKPRAAAKPAASPISSAWLGSSPVPAQAPPPAAVAPTPASSAPAIAGATPVPPPPPPSPPPPILERPQEKDKVETPSAIPRRRLTVTLNPLAAAAGRYGFNVELLPFRHHAIVATGFAQTFPTWMLERLVPKAIDASKGAEMKVGGELGYRFYTGGEGAHGLFVGLSGLAMPIAYPRVTPELRSEVVSFYAYGGALDVGVSAMTSSGFTIGGGLGVMGLAYTPPPSIKPPPGITVPTLPEPHVLPRVLLAAGWSF